MGIEAAMCMVGDEGLTATVSCQVDISVSWLYLVMLIVFAKDFEGSKSNHLVVKLREGMSVARLPQRTDFNSSTKYPLTKQVCRVLCIS